MQFQTPIFLNKNSVHPINENLLKYDVIKNNSIISYNPNERIKFTFKGGVNSSSINQLLKNSDVEEFSTILGYDARLKIRVTKSFGVVLKGQYINMFNVQSQYLSIGFMYKIKTINKKTLFN